MSLLTPHTELRAWRHFGRILDVYLKTSFDLDADGCQCDQCKEARAIKSMLDATRDGTLPVPVDSD